MNTPDPCRRTTAVLASAALVLLTPLALPAQSAREVLDAAMEAHRSRTEGIENYTVIQTVMGFRTTTHFERRTVDGESVLVPVSTMGSEAGQQVPENPYRMYGTLAERAELVGTEAVDGEECHVVEVTDLEGTGLAEAGPADSRGGWSPERLRMWVDTEDYVPRKMRMEEATSADGTGQPASFTVLFRDYRDVEGMLHPFRMELRTEGMGGGMSEEERADLQESMAKMRKQMENMSPRQRKMMEKVMGGQLEKMEKMLTAGALDFTVTVEEIRVNEGPPEGG